MAPDDEKVRLQNRNATEEKGVDETLLSSVNDLSGNHFAIDGIVFSLDGFNHQGGEQIKLFGVNDVTVQYKMIHPHHTSKQLRKLQAVGSLPKSEIEYQFDSPFEGELKEEVFKVVRRGQVFGTYGYIARAIVYIAFYVVWIVQGSTWTLAAVFGIAHALIGLNVQHDANHGAASRKPFVNDLLGFGVDIIGGSKWLWMEQHWTHHA